MTTSVAKGMRRGGSSKWRKRKISVLMLYVVLAMNGAIFVTPIEVKAHEDPLEVWVDDDFEDEEENHKWSTIQGGIDDVGTNGTVWVYEGTYNETLIISKSLNLTGNSSANTTIGPNGPRPLTAITINGSAFVNISGFSIVEIEAETLTGIEVTDMSTLYASECNFTNMGEGVIAQNGGVLHIENNSFYRSKYFSQKNTLRSIQKQSQSDGADWAQVRLAMETSQQL